MMAAFDVDIRLAGLLVSTYAIAAAVGEQVKEIIFHMDDVVWLWAW
jgi:hypothetical protein